MLILKNGDPGAYSWIAIFRFSSITFIEQVMVSESHPTSRLTLGKPRIRKRRNPWLLSKYTFRLDSLNNRPLRAA